MYFNVWMYWAKCLLKPHNKKLHSEMLPNKTISDCCPSFHFTFICFSYCANVSVVQHWRNTGPFRWGIHIQSYWNCLLDSLDHCEMYIVKKIQTQKIIIILLGPFAMSLIYWWSLCITVCNVYVWIRQKIKK